MLKAAIVMGSDSDLGVLSSAANILGQFSVPFEIKILSAHRTTEAALLYAASAEKRGFGVIIAGAGAAAHLPGVLAAATLLPVIGIPVNATPLAGMDALLSIVQMPPGIPVATVGINNAKNAGLLAVQILSLKERSLRARFKAYREKMKKEVLAKTARLDKIGYKKYLQEMK
ncbi:MAG: 5-(carboxyamino)imidazole ribonucleotide mutase [Elusimicrobia bacterium CG_4_10_14_0_2_um_filter_56_8]|nr:MAG: 5-(carboxyamino)imidazole ribonucleotide mutase [Elusimicrobia bacterium CG1_02_56_21]PJA14361.1 MAG: 5-(carboxyamino)imidazole ribonucleotide mutase [Elusimicrobia bacterium CG_4_10_14_0_2_um_filter_56_8]